MIRGIQWERVQIKSKKQRSKALANTYLIFKYSDRKMLALL